MLDIGETFDPHGVDQLIRELTQRDKLVKHEPIKSIFWVIMITSCY